MAEIHESAQPAATSLRSSAVAAGKTMSAKRAIGFHHDSCTITVSGRRQARTSRLRSWWWWNGLPPHQ